jgi:hypothetical protein
VIDGPTDPATARAVESARAITGALASGNWAAARALDPADRRTNRQLQAAYGAVTDATLIPAKERRSGNTVDLRLGLVAHEDDPSGPQTAVMCVHWRANLATETVHRISSARLRLLPGRLDPQTFATELKQVCANYPLR